MLIMVWAGPVEDYLRGFSWNKVKYRSDKSIAQLLDSLHKVRFKRYLERERERVKLIIWTGSNLAG